MALIDGLSGAGAFSFLHLLFPAARPHTHAHARAGITPSRAPASTRRSAFRGASGPGYNPGEGCTSWEAAGSSYPEPPAPGPYLLVSKRGK